MTAIKSNILKRMDESPAGVRVACVKFLQRIVLIQTPGALIPDPRVCLKELDGHVQILTSYSVLNKMKLHRLSFLAIIQYLRSTDLKLKPLAFLTGC